MNAVLPYELVASGGTSVWDRGHLYQTGPRWSSLKERERVSRYNWYLCIALARP